MEASEIFCRKFEEDRLENIYVFFLGVAEIVLMLRELKRRKVIALGENMPIDGLGEVRRSACHEGGDLIMNECLTLRMMKNFYNSVLCNLPSPCSGVHQ